MNWSLLFLAVTKALTVLFGGTITYLSYQAYARTSSPALRALTVGIGLVTTGVVLGGVLHQIGGLPLETSVSIQSVFSATGFAVLTYSLYTRQPTPRRSDPGGSSSARTETDESRP